MQHFYDGQIRRYLIQIVRLLSNFTVKYGDGTLARVPVTYGDADRQAAHVINQNSENTLSSTPKIAIYISDLDLDRSRLGDPSFVSKVHIRERDIENNQYTSSQGANYTVERLMPTPYNLTLKVDIWSSSTEQKLQILEQILTLFNPSLEIQSTDNYLDWTSLTVVELEDVTFSSRSIPQGANISIDIASLNLKTPIYLTPPAKVKKLGVVTNIIMNVFGNIGTTEGGYLEGLGVDENAGSTFISDYMTVQKVNVSNLELEVIGTNVKLKLGDGSGDDKNWQELLDQYPGKYRSGLSKVFLYQTDGSEVVGFIALNPIDNTIITANWDEDTFPTNDSIEGPSRAEASWGSFDAIIDPTVIGPNSGLSPVVGSRYLILENIGGGIIDTFAATARVARINTGIDYDKVYEYALYVNGTLVSATDLDKDGIFFLVPTTVISVGSTITYTLNLNDDGPDAWKNSDGSDFIAFANDIIEWDGSNWHVVFSAAESAEELIWQTNLFTLTQYKWNGISWVKSFEGEYKQGEWRLEL